MTEDNRLNWIKKIRENSDWKLVKQCGEQLNSKGFRMKEIWFVGQWCRCWFFWLIAWKIGENSYIQIENSFSDPVNSRYHPQNIVKPDYHVHRRIILYSERIWLKNWTKKSGISYIFILWGSSRWTLIFMEWKMVLNIAQMLF